MGGGSMAEWSEHLSLDSEDNRLESRCLHLFCSKSVRIQFKKALPCSTLQQLFWGQARQPETGAINYQMEMKRHPRKE